MKKQNKTSSQKPKLVVIKNDPKNINKSTAKPVKTTPKSKKSTPAKSKKAKKTKKPASSRSRIKFLNFKNILLCIVAIVLILAIIYILSNEQIVHIGDKENFYSTEFGVNSKADFCVIDDNVFHCTKDTATLLDTDGKPIWTDTFSMVSPAMLYDGKFVGLADVKNKILNVYSKTGKVYSLEADGNITSFAINSLGATAVICKNSNDNDYTVSVYNSKGEKMFMGSYVSSDGIPMTVDISDDSSKVAVGFLNVGGINISSNILFYSTDKAVAATIENSDAMFAAVNCDNEMVGSIKFLNDDSCIIATDKSLINIGGKNVAAYEQNWKHNFTNYVTALDVIDSDYVAVAYGEIMEDSEDSVNKNSIYWYNAKTGNVKSSVVMDMPVSKLSSDLGNSIAELEDNTFIALSPKGNELWKYEGIQNIQNILFYGDTDTIAVVSATKMTLTDVTQGASNTEKQKEDTEETTVETTSQSAAETTSQPSTNS